MRLIDADVLKKEVDFQQEHMWPEDLSYYIPKMIDKQPVVPAIPVEWLKAQLKPYTGDVSDIGKSARNGTVKDLIRKWQKEQEAQDE